MAWFRNHYDCDRCGSSWTDEWSCTCDDDCPHCGARHMSPSESDDLSEIIVPESNGYIVYRSPESAAHSPNYEFAGKFKTLEEAAAFLSAGDEAG